MAPTRPSSQKGKQDKEQTPASLLADAETQIEVGNADEAIELAIKALELTGEGGDFELRALTNLGIYYLEVGEEDEAREYLTRAARLDKDGTLGENIGGGPDKFFLLAQLSEEGGRDSVRWFELGAAALRKRLQSLGADGNGQKSREQQTALEETQAKLGEVLCAVAEVYMTDLSWESDAEQRCEALITEAMMLAPGSPETWQTVANVRISQERGEEARAALRRSLELWQDLPPGDPKVPAFPTRVSLVRLLMETGMEEQALVVLEHLVTDDDSSVEVWYLGGWCLFVAGEKLKEAWGQQQKGDEGGEKEAQQDGGLDGEEWRSTWKYARKWLMTCLKLYEAEEYEDDRLGQHAVELLQSIYEELGEPQEGDEDEDEWEGISDDEHDHDHRDEEMQG